MRAVAVKVLLATILVVIAWSAVAVYRERAALNEPVDVSQAHFTGSQACVDCHADRHESWYATFHRTMTQEATPDSVQGRFDGQPLDYWGLRMRPVSEDGRYYFEYSEIDTGEVVDRREIVRTVGSHRYQQYMTYVPETGNYVRLHYLWHNGDQRWVHMNAAFLGPDEQDYSAQVSVWNQNCIFCHNTGPEPRMTNYDDLVRRARAGEAVDIRTESLFESRVAELGISCETCHGPGSLHVERAGSFLTRTAMRLNGGRDAAIVNPEGLAAEQSTQVCGQCHGQRLPKTNDMVREWIHAGPTFRAGQNLNDHVQPVWKHTPAPAQADENLFSLRFWADGTPRLSAYEYQGLLQSACYRDAELTCIDCHTVHGGDPVGQISDRNRGNQPCLRCHQDFRPESALVAHTRHPADSEGSRCYNCHMPDAVYGVMDIHRTHRIESPDAVRDAAAGRPNACLNCHLEATPKWVAAQLDQDPDAVVRLDGADAGLSEAAALLAGDPVQKAIIGYRAGQPGAQTGIERAWLVPYLLQSMADKYPSSRRFARDSLRQILSDFPDAAAAQPLLWKLDQFDFIAPVEQRMQTLDALHELWRSLDKSAWPTPAPATAVSAEYTLDETVRLALLELGGRQDKQISIGE